MRKATSDGALKARTIRHCGVKEPIIKDEMTEIELEQVCKFTSTHCDRQPQTSEHSWEEKLLQDADLLDHYGSQGIWMSISYYAYTTQQEMNQVPEFYMGEWQKQISEHRKLLK